LGSASFTFQLADPDREVAQAGQHRGARACLGAAGILGRGDIASVMRAVLDGRPVSADDAQEPGLVVLLGREAGRVAADSAPG